MPTLTRTAVQQLIDEARERANWLASNLNKEVPTISRDPDRDSVLLRKLADALEDRL